ncbi:prophage CP4-57 regulatory [Escherichia coli M056]|uniref:helix-turn-helix transcriptional regulator n=1 Tax=Escherichia coli TaxID=562 RepID=UPI000A186FBB|nr:AlpA family phage regulatory protein [Escherichia coli]OSK32956.1 prophage CP4-57 regulatory [Escherichia coli M056]
MNQSAYTQPTPEQRRTILAEYGFEYDARIREQTCKQMTSLSRSRRWELEQIGAFPPRHSLGRCSCTWLLSDVLWWLRHPPVIDNVNNPYENAQKKRAKELGGVSAE